MDKLCNLPNYQFGERERERERDDLKYIFFLNQYKKLDENLIHEK